MMSHHTCTGSHDKEADSLPDASTGPQGTEVLEKDARQLARNLAWIPSARSSKVFAVRCKGLAKQLSRALRLARKSGPHSLDSVSLLENTALLESSFGDVYDSLHKLRRIPHVRRPDGAIIPRALAIAEDCARSAGYRCDEIVFSLYISAYQEVTVLNLLELWVTTSALKLVLLECLVENNRVGIESETRKAEVEACLQSLRVLSQIRWRPIIEPLIVFDQLLHQDPAGAYRRMEPESRDLYRNAVANIADYSDLSEQEVARAALELAQKASRSRCDDVRLASRISHIGDYLIAEGAATLKLKAGFRQPLTQWLRSFARSYPDEFYLPAIALLTAIIAGTIIHLSEFDFWSFQTYVFLLLILMLPCSEAAIQIVNYVALSFLTPQPIPKLDFSDGIPADCVTLVTVPTLLLNEQQVRKVVDALEIRFLGNQDPNLHFALLTDLPDSPTPPAEIDPLAVLCADLIENLNEKYANCAAGSFFLFHRERRYNPRERAWMGWERKRGKLIELNRFLREGKDGYAIAVGNLAIMPTVRFVVALDADTLLPRDTARRMVGTLAHPLNQAIVDPDTNIVVAGYGILQPRVGVSIRSAARSRLAKIWSGQTGLDIYTRAVSDVYQDLYGEGTYVGKGIYEVEVLHRILGGRFPSNLLLSHDLIEGAYARSGLVSDIEIIEDYPSLYSAYNRRKHRWLRGDWQIVEWLFSKVPAPGGRRVTNPISLVSKWKILDNLRRSLVEPATFLLFVLGWLVLPGSAWYWNLATLCLLFLPNFVRLLFHLARAAVGRDPSLVGNLPDSLFAANLGVLLGLVFLAHQMLVALDAMVRALVRRAVTGERLLEWVTAAQEEQDSQRRTTLDAYLDWTPVLAFALGAIVWLMRGRAVFAALPILLLWAASKPISVWLNRSPHTRRQKSESDRIFLRRIALRTWRFFAEFSRADTNWLIPDNVQEAQLLLDRRLSPTNLGFLLNARQAACQLGYLTVPDFAESTGRTLASVAGMRRYHGHFYNWYNADTTEPLHPFVISTADSGNVVASLWTLEQGCLEQLRKPLIDAHIAEGVADYLRELVRIGSIHRRVLRTFLRQSRTDWLEAIAQLPLIAYPGESQSLRADPESQWFRQQLSLLTDSFHSMLRLYTPWLLPEFRPLHRPLQQLGIALPADIDLADIPGFIDTLRLLFESPLSDDVSNSLSTGECRLREQLRTLLPAARENSVDLIRDLRAVASKAAELVEETDFAVLLSPARRLLAVALDAETGRLSAECYDQLASESRIATFVAIGKNDIPQETWFSLIRRHRILDGHGAMLSWAGTMFEYLMPCVWMHTYPDTLLDRAGIEAVYAQRVYAGQRGVPWGASESASSQRLDGGGYHYFAYGVPGLALRDTHPAELVISPYSTLLALHVSPSESLANLHSIQRSGWLGTYGMYEAADFRNQDGHRRARPELVRIWMAHHQGMSLLAITNSLCNGVFRRWFHSNPFVQSAELLLQERPLTRMNFHSGRPRIAA
jgi:cyclic beta-1,2-glucan synthetase